MNAPRPDSFTRTDRLFRKFQRHVQRVHEFFDLDGLGEIAEESRLQALLDVARHGVGAEGDDGDVRGGRVFAQDFQGSMPLMPGRLMSIRITSGWVARASSMPRVPFTAVSRRMSGRRAMSCSTSFMFAGLSST